MPVTLMNPIQIRSVSEVDVKKAEKKFIVYAFICAVILVLIVYGVYTDIYQLFKGNTIWTFGSYFSFISVLYSKFFHVKNNLSRENQRIDSNTRNGKVKFLEKVFELLWILGFVLIVVSRWIKL